MKKRIIAIFLLASMLFAGIACDSTTEPEGSSEAPSVDVTEAGVTDPAEETTQTDETTQSEETTAEVTAEPNILDKSKTYNILFIGNSYTHYNDMPEQIFSKVISSAGYKANVTCRLLSRSPLSSRRIRFPQKRLKRIIPIWSLTMSTATATTPSQPMRSA